MRKLLVKVLFILMLCVGSAGIFVSPVYSDPDALLEELRLKYGPDCRYERLELGDQTWIMVFDGDGKITDLFPSND